MTRFTGNSWAAVIGVLSVAQFVVVLDVTVVATALPAIGADLGFAPALLSWVITAYTVAFGGLLLPGGRVVDLAGAGRIFQAGFGLFTVASLACACAPTPQVLIVARIAQGVGAALLSPAALAALGEQVRDAARRRRALGWWTAAGAVGGASGWVLGGLITEVAGWRWVFAVNVPIGIAALLVSRRVLAGRGPVRQPIRTPLVPASLIRTPGVVGGNLTAAALTASTTPAMLAVVLYIQDTLRLPPARGALLFPAFNVAVVGGSLLAPRVLARAGLRKALLYGFGGVLAGIGLLLTLPRAGTPALTLLGAFVLMGLGLGTASVASTTAGSVEVNKAERGIAAGLLNSTAQLGNAFGLAVAAPLVASAAPMTGYRLAFATAAAIAVAGALSVLTISRRPAELRTRSRATCTGPRCPS